MRRCGAWRTMPPMSDTTTLSTCPYSVAVIMERVRLNNRWATEKWEAKGVVLDAPLQGSRERVIVDEENVTQVLFPSMKLKLEIMLDCS